MAGMCKYGDCHEEAKGCSVTTTFATGDKQRDSYCSTNHAALGTLKQALTMYPFYERMDRTVAARIISELEAVLL